MSATAPELRAQLREWRRGRAGIGLRELLEEVYVALLATAVLGSMALSAVLHAGRLAVHCGAAGCVAARTATPYLVAAGWLWLVLGVVGLLGPLVISSASSSWLFSTPVDRAALLRPQLAAGLVLSAVVGALVPAGIGAGCGWPLPSALILGLLTGLLSATAYASAVVEQARRGEQRRLSVLRRAGAVVLALVVVAGLAAVGAGRITGAAPLRAPAGIPLAAAALVALIAAGVVAGRSLTTLSRRVLDEGAGLTSGLAGALAALDFALAYDVVMARVARAPRTPTRLRGRGLAALAWADLARLRRAPGRVLALVGMLPVAYALRALDVGAFVAPLTMTALLPTGLMLLPGLRAVSVSPTLPRALGASDASLRLGALAVPAGLMLLLGVTTAPAMPGGLLAGLAVGLGSTAAAVRWVTGRPPDYGRPLVSTPAGGVPTNLYLSIVRGLDVVALVSVPLLLSPTTDGAAISLALEAVVLGVLVLRR
jgi:hypothetical protein